MDPICSISGEGKPDPGFLAGQLMRMGFKLSSDGRDAIKEKYGSVSRDIVSFERRGAYVAIGQEQVYVWFEKQEPSCEYIVVEDYLDAKDVWDVKEIVKAYHPNASADLVDLTGARDYVAFVCFDGEQVAYNYLPPAITLTHHSIDEIRDVWDKVVRQRQPRIKPGK